MDIPMPMPEQQLPPEAHDQAIRETQKTPVRKPRTRQAAERAYRLSRIPDHLALPMPGLLAYSLSFNENQFAYLQTIRPSVMEHISFRDGATYLDYSVADYVRLHLFYENDPKVISNIDTILLRALYSIVLEAQIPLATSREGILEVLLRPRDIDRTFTIYLPDVAQVTDHEHITDNSLQALLNKFQGYSNVIGIINQFRTSRGGDAFFPVIQSFKYDEATNTISFFSPYLNRLALHNMYASFLPSRDGRYAADASHSYLVDFGIMKERNKRAAEIACALAVTIDQFKDAVVKITYRDLIRQCSGLQNAIKATGPTAEKNRVLNRAFSRAWELLESHTYLYDQYKVLMSYAIPTMADLSDELEIKIHRF